MAMMMINTSTMGRTTCCGTYDTAAAPMKDMTKALATAGSTSSHGICTLPTKERAANVVPQADASLFVPSKDVEAMFGIRLNRAGSCISPPPPTAASIRPAKKANKHSSEMVSMIGNKEWATAAV